MHLINVMRTFIFCDSLNSFEELYRYLVKSLPVVVSIRGPLKTMPVKKTYSEGHLLVVVVGTINRKKCFAMIRHLKQRRMYYMPMT